MHIAICDDHIADRKQMERLLGRESERRIPSTGVLYVDSYGSRPSLLAAPMIYDAIFLDITEDGGDIVSLLQSLRAKNTQTPVILCCGSVNYRLLSALPPNVMFLDKPIQTGALSAMVDTLLLIKGRQIKKLEFRNSSETFYLKEEELIYAVPDGERRIKMYLTTGEEKWTDMTPANFCSSLECYPSYIPVSNRMVLNLYYIDQISLFGVTLTNGKRFRLPFGEAKKLQKAWRSYRGLQPEG